MNYKSQDQPRSGPYEPPFATKMAPNSISKKHPSQGRHPASKGAHPQNILYAQDANQEFEEHPANYGSKWSSKQDLSVTDYPMSTSELRSPQARKPGDSDPSLLAGASKRTSGSKRDPVPAESGAKHSALPLSHGLSAPDVVLEPSAVAADHGKPRPLKAVGRSENPAPQLPVPDSASLKTPSSKMRGQLSSKNNSDFYPNGPSGPSAPYTPEPGFDGASKGPMAWLPNAPVQAANTLPTWPQSGEMVRADLAAAHGLGFMMSPYVYSPAAGMPQFSTPLFLEESITPLEPAKRREWSISYYAFPGLV